jgi:hypothetical protein
MNPARRFVARRLCRLAELLAVVATLAAGAADELERRERREEAKRQRDEQSRWRRELFGTAEQLAGRLCNVRDDGGPCRTCIVDAAERIEDFFPAPTVGDSRR